MNRIILILAANPKDTSQLRLDQEVREIHGGLQRAKMRDTLSLVQRWAVRPEDIRRAMLEVRPNIVHFCGHGGGEEGLAFEDDSGYANLISADALEGFFELFANNVECVVLNACYSEIQARAISKHIGYVIGMKNAIGDAIAIKFAVAFYDALGAGESYDFAFRLAYNAVKWEKMQQDLVPILILKNNPQGANDITGCWKDPSDDDIVYFIQRNNIVIGIYDFGEKTKVGFYIGWIEGNVFRYKWQWYNNRYHGHGIMDLLGDNKRLYGTWWFDDRSESDHVGFKYINKKMPQWLNEDDFENLWAMAPHELSKLKIPHELLSS